jgi:hypothetical protein
MWHGDPGLPEPLQGPVVTVPAETGHDRDSAAAADIIWTNRSTTTTGGTGDNDHFGAVFGVNANKARAVVDAVITAYERMIGSFNYGDGSSTYNLQVSMATSGTSLGASANLTGQSFDSKPKSGSITMGRGGGGTGGGWFLDPTPDDNSEFMGGIVNAFSGDATPGGPAAGLSDFYTVVAAEMTHCMGLFGNALPGWTNHTTNTFANDTQAGPGFLYVYQGPSIKHLLTSDNGGFQDWGSAIHSSEPGNSVTFGGVQYIGAQDQGNAIYEQNRRYMVNNTFALMFKDSYNFASVDPAQFGTMYVVRNATTGAVTVRGSGGVDTISISQTGSTITLSVDPQADVPGSGALAGNGNLPAFVTSFDAAQVTSITVDASDGNDTITVGNVTAAVPLSIDAGIGNDTVVLGGGNLAGGFPANLTVNGNAGTDTVTFDDSASTGDLNYVINGATLTTPALPALNLSSFEGVGLIANNFDNTINVELATGPISVNAGGGNDTINLGNGSVLNLPSPVTVDGGAGTNDRVVIDDSTRSNNEFYVINGTSLSVAFFGGLNASNIEGLKLIAQQGGDFINVQNTAAGVPITIQANGGQDQITVDSTVAGAPVIVENSPGNDNVSVNADNSGTAQVQFTSPVTTLGSLTIGAGGTATVVAGGGRVLRVTGLTVNNAGALDLNDGVLLFNYSSSSPITTIQTLLGTGYNAGAWDGNGIRSTTAHNDAQQRTALGYAEATDLFANPTSFAGQSIDDTTVIVKYTFYGDTNLDGTVNLTDFNALASHFGQSPIRWFGGNLDYDNDVDLADFNKLASNFGQTGLASQPSSLATINLPGGKKTSVSPPAFGDSSRRSLV